MSVFSGKQGKGVLAKHKEKKRIDAEVRNEAYQEELQEFMRQNPDVPAKDAAQVVQVARRQRREMPDPAKELLEEVFSK